MIEVIYYRNHHRITVTGHARSDEPGKDLVCAACSILVHTLAANLRQLEKTGHAREVTILTEPGKAELACRAERKFRHLTRRILDGVCAGFEILAANSPEYISYEIHGGWG